MNELEVLTAEELAFRVQQGSRRCFAELANRFGPRLYHYFRRKVPSREDCEDLVQETLVKAYTKIQAFNRSRKFSTWIFTIGTRHAVDLFRSRSRVHFDAIPEDLVADSDPYAAAARQEEREYLWACARKLPSRQYDALWLHYAEAMSLKEIAQVLGLTSVHVKVLLYRARMALALKEKTLAKSGHKSGGDEAFKKALSC